MNRVGQVWESSWGTIVIVIEPYNDRMSCHPAIMIFKEMTICDTYYEADCYAWENNEMMKRLA